MGRDAQVAYSLLHEASIVSTICPDLESLKRSLSENTLFVVVTEETMNSTNLRPLSEWIERQPEWSDLPFIVLTQKGGGLERNPVAGRLLEVLGNVTFLERPFHPTTFLSVARTALKGRQRQYDARARMEQLREGEDRLRTALMAGHLGAWEIDLHTLTLTTSDTAKAIFGRKPEDEFTYQEMFAAILPEDQKRMEESVRASIEEGADYATEYRIVWPDGSLHWADIYARIVTDKRGYKSFVGVVSDITDRKQAEERLKQLNETLEARVLERTKELERAHHSVLEEMAQRERAEQNLRQSQKMEVVGQITGGVAHDFNNLLMAVMGNLDLLRKHFADDTKATRLLEGALQGARRGAVLTQRLLAFARRQDLHVEPKGLTELVRGMTELIDRSVGSQVELRFELAENLPLALVDTNQIELSLLNLVINARDAMPDGGLLTIATDLVENTVAGDIPPGHYVRLIVTDTGSGMDEETLSKAMEPFFSTKELGKGTGLGLSMIHGLALQLNGLLTLQSELGQGTRAELWLPVTSQPMTVILSPQEAKKEESVPSGLMILVVDDDALIAMSTVDMLEDLGHKVLEAHSGERALQLLREHEAIDLMITDYSMPRMTGAQLAEAARAMRPDLPILLATGYAELPSGSTIDLPRLAKPYRQDQLATEITRIFEKSRSALAH